MQAEKWSFWGSTQAFGAFSLFSVSHSFMGKFWLANNFFRKLRAHSLLSLTAGMIATRSFNFLYGTVEFRAKFSGGNGTGSWPIVLMYSAGCQESDPTGTDNNCDGEEIDIAEFLRSSFKNVNQQMHVSHGTHHDQCLPALTDASQRYHIYNLVWSPGSLVFKIDGVTTCRIIHSYVPSVLMYLKVDQFVGGIAGGTVRDASLPWILSIDYLKVVPNGAIVFEDDFNASVVQKPQ